MTAFFVRPEWIPALALAWLGLAAAVAMARVRAARRRRLLFGSSARGGAGGARELLLLAALAAVAIAALGPRSGTRVERVSASGLDVVVLLDVSRSMDARDVPPSRLDRARRAAEGLLAGLAPGDRAALAAFAARGVLVAPLSHDHAALAGLLPALDTTLVRPGASRLGAGVARALEAFDPGSERPRVLVVLSDGEDADATPDLGRAELLRDGVRVVAVGFGSEEGAAIPNQGLELRDRRGRPVRTRLDTERLFALASATGGELLATDRFGAVDEAALLAAVRRDAALAAETGFIERRVPAVRTVPVAALALALLLFDALRRPGGAGRPGRAGSFGTFSWPTLRIPSAGRAGILVALGLVAAAPGSAPRDQRAFERGLALADAGHWLEAERAFRAAALLGTRAERSARAYYGAGVAALEAGRFEAARDAFFEAVALAPEDLEARFNLEWTLQALEANPPPPPPQPSPSEADASSPEPPDDSSDETPEPERARLPPPPELTPEEVARFLERTRDDPTRALRGLRENDPRAEGSPW